MKQQAIDEQFRGSIEDLMQAVDRASVQSFCRDDFGRVELCESPR